MVVALDWVHDHMDIVAHIFFAAGTVDEVLVTTPSGEFSGTLANPGPDGVVIRSEGPIPALQPRDPVCVEYTGPTDQYRFYTEVVSATTAGVLVEVPYAVERNDLRLTERYSVPHGAGFYFRATGLPGAPLYPLHDISMGGIGLYDLPAPAPEPGDRLVGELRLPGEQPIPMTLQVRHIALRKGRVLLGARIAAITLANQGRLSGFLQHWRPQS